jgi:hypothetical protein
MSPTIRAVISRGCSILTIAVLLPFLTVHGHGQSRAARLHGPFENLAGSWTGGGTVTLPSGATERIRCRARYRVGQSGDTLRQELLCASASYKFELSSDVSARAGTISGTWSESTRNTGGTISGSVLGDGRIQAAVDGMGFSAILSLRTGGNRQSVQLVTRGPEPTTVTITLNRA